MRAVLLTLTALGALGCEERRLTLRYSFDPADVAVSAVARVQTTLTPTAPQAFAGPVPATPIGTGVSYTVVCANCATDPCPEDCRLQMTIIHDRDAGFVFDEGFLVRFAANPEGTPERLVVSAVARDPSDAVTAAAPETEAMFGGAVIELFLRNRIRCGAILCERTELCCDDRCVDPGADVRHCGRCDQACGAEERCAGGECRCGAQPGCSDGQRCCDGVTCADVKDDPANCGTCGTKCRQGETCAAGVCRCGDAPGAAACMSGERCCGTGGECVLPTDTCPCGPPAKGLFCSPTQTCCGESCLDLASDTTHCGSCARSCLGLDPNLTCSGGNCTCGTMSCGSDCCSGNCVDQKSDEQNCGGCGVRCGFNEICDGGVCRCGAGGGACNPGGGSPTVCCGPPDQRSCVARDTVRCGDCLPCLPGETCGASASCVCAANTAGGTPARCPAGQACCADGCKSTDVDANNCGLCGRKCAANEGCVGGSCTPITCPQSCTNNGNTCNGTTCSCNGGPECLVAAGKCCAGIGCVNLTNDANNCGSCGHKCATGEACLGSACHCGGAAGPTCAAGDTCCPPTGVCENLTTSTSSCGACGVACGNDEDCVGGRCTCGADQGAVGGGRVCATAQSCAGGCRNNTSQFCWINGAVENCTMDGYNYCCANCPGGGALMCGVTMNNCTAAGCSAF
jgi:hypothetical protein